MKAALQASLMQRRDAHKAEVRLTLNSRLADLQQVWPWVDALAAERNIPAETLFAIHLCLEEALSNVIRHGYRGEPNHAIELSFAAGEENGFTFTIVDSAPYFAPDEPDKRKQASRASSPVDALGAGELKIGGHGLQLMRRFAGSLCWERVPGGNRLTITFPCPAANDNQAH